MAKKGRKPKPYITTWGEVIPDLARDSDGRWRIVPTRQRFAESDERLAIMRFRRWQQSQSTVARVAIDVQDIPAGQDQAIQAGGDWLALRLESDGTRTLGSSIPEAILWHYVREQILKDAVRVAELTGIPQLANLASMDIPKPSIKLADLIALYKEKSTSIPQTKASTVAAFKQLIKSSSAKTLADLTTPALLAFREGIVNSNKSPGTVAAYFGRVKWIVGFAKKWGFDTKQLDETLSRMAVLHPPKNTSPLDPQPIDPGDYQKLLKAAKNDARWTGVLLVAMNFCLHIDECFAIQWDEIDLGKGVFVSRRSKTKVRRVATLWPETAAALKEIKRTQSPWVFTSTHGTRFNSKGQWKRWNAIRIAAGLPDVKFDQIRDGAYTVAMEGATDERQARVVAGHRVHGLTDNYVARNPGFVRPAIKAVHRVYMLH